MKHAELKAQLTAAQARIEYLQSRCVGLAPKESASALKDSLRMWRVNARTLERRVKELEFEISALQGQLERSRPLPQSFSTGTPRPGTAAKRAASLRTGKPGEPCSVPRMRSAWGDDPPPWIVRLAEACDRKSQEAVARVLGISGAVVNQVLGRRYKGRMDRIEARVISAPGLDRFSQG